MQRVYHRKKRKESCYFLRRCGKLVRTTLERGDGMKTERAYPRFTITQKGTRWVEQGHPWIYEGEILSGQGELRNGCLADAVSEKGKYLGTGFYSQSSKIRLRLISRNANDSFDEAFWRRRIQYA